MSKKTGNKTATPAKRTKTTTKRSNDIKLEEEPIERIDKRDDEITSLQAQIDDAQNALSQYKSNSKEVVALKKKISTLSERLAKLNLDELEDEDSGALAPPDLPDVRKKQLTVQEQETLTRKKLIEVAKLLGKEPPDFNSPKNPLTIRRNLAIAKSYFERYGPTTVIIERYNLAVSNIENAFKKFTISVMDDIIDEKTKKSKQVRETVTFTDVKLEKPFVDQGSKTSSEVVRLLPAQCRRQKLSYTFSVKGKIVEKKEEVIVDPETNQVSYKEISNVVSTEDTELAKIHCMLGSSMCWLDIKTVPKEARYKYDECPSDPFGYFIARGKPTRLIGQEKLSVNTDILINTNLKKGKDAGAEITVLSKTPEKSIANHVCYERYQSSQKTMGNVGLFIAINDLINTNNDVDIVTFIRFIMIGSIVLLPEEELNELRENPDRNDSYKRAEVLIRRIAGELIPDNEALKDEFLAYIQTTLDLSSSKTDDEVLDNAVNMHNIPGDEFSDIDPDKKAESSGNFLNHILERLFPHIDHNSYLAILDAMSDTIFGNVDIDETDRANLIYKLQIQLTIHYKIYMLLMLPYRLFIYRRVNTEYDDRDHFGLKRVDLAHSLVESLCYKSLQNANKTIVTAYKQNAEKTALAETVRKYFAGTLKGKGNSPNITSTFESNFSSTEGWGFPKSKQTQKAVAEALDTESLPAMVSGIRQVTSKGDRARIIEPHLFHTSQAGLFCVFETSDDSSCGIKKYLATSADISVEYPTDEFIRDFAEQIKIYNKDLSSKKQLHIIYPFDANGRYEEFDQKTIKEYLPLYVNGSPLGYAKPALLDIARKWRRKARPDQLPLLHIEIWLKRRARPGHNQLRVEMHITTSANRMIRPLHYCDPTDDDPNVMELAIDRAQRDYPKVDLYNTKWDDLVFKYHVIGYVGKNEEQTYTTVVAWYPWNLANSNGIVYTHCEINPLFIFGYNAGSVPFTANQQGTRTAYAAGQQKHSIGVPSQVYSQRFETTTKILINPQMPLVFSEIFRAAGYYGQPSTTNLKIAIIAYGENVEDGVLVSKSAAQRGLCNSLTFNVINIAGDTPGKFDMPIVENKLTQSKPRQTVGLSTRTERGFAPKLTRGGTKAEKIVPKITAGSFEHLGTQFPSEYILERARKAKEEGIELKVPNAVPPGIVRPGTTVQEDDVLATKVRPGNESTIEFKQTFRKNVAARVADVQLMGGASGPGASAQIKTCTANTLAEGDKLADTTSQKGLIGRLVPQENMPFSENGETFDLLFNPHGFPSRQTLSFVKKIVAANARLAGIQNYANKGIAGAQLYNRVYTISSLRDFFLRPNLTAKWFNEYANNLLKGLREAYVESDPDSISVERISPIKIRGEVSFDDIRNITDKRYKGEADKIVKELIESTKRYTNIFLYKGKKKTYKVDKFPLNKIEENLPGYLGLIIEAINSEREKGGEREEEEERKSKSKSKSKSKKQQEVVLLESADDLTLDVLEEYRQTVYDTIYNNDPKLDALIDVPNGIYGIMADRIYGIARFLPNVDDLYSTEQDLSKVNSLSLETLREYDEDTVNRIEKYMEIKDVMDELWDKYSKTAEGKREQTFTDKGKPAKRVPLSYIEKEDKRLAKDITRYIKNKFVPIVDVIKLKDQSEESLKQLAINRAKREDTERLKSSAINATPFNTEVSTEELVDYLQKLGMEDGGLQTLISGETGLPLICRVMTGFADYNTQTQQAAEKIQARGTGGAISAVTRRPNGGKQNKGAIKNEEMAGIVNISHGARRIIKDRLDEATSMSYITQCGLCYTPCANEASDEEVCHACNAKGSMQRVPLPWNSRRLLDILSVVGVNSTLIGRPRDNNIFRERRNEALNQDLDAFMADNNILEDIDLDV